MKRNSTRQSSSLQESTSPTSSERVHYTAPYLLNPVHRITVTLVGAGGTGSQMLSCLARMDHDIRALGHRGLRVTVYDPDTVEPTNVGRQLFGPGDIGANKAVAIVARYNRAFGLDWTAVPQAYDPDKSPFTNITVTCVDKVAPRLAIGKAFRKQTTGHPEHRAYYWMDLGNTQKTGQVILASSKIEQPESSACTTVDTLPSVTEEFDLRAVHEKDSGPSCSMAEALSKQSLFINSTLAQMGAALLWNILREYRTDVRGLFVNLDTFKVLPLKV